MSFRSFIIFFGLVFFSKYAVAQVPAPPPPDLAITLEIRNQYGTGGNFFFDLYLNANTGGPGNLYLGTADFVLTFNSANFTGPALSLVPGSCNFVPNNVGNAATCQALYEANMSTDILFGNQLVINLNTIPAANMTALNNNIANITTTGATHRLGTFMVSGVTNPSGTMGLQWKTSGGVFTDVYYYATNFNTYQTKMNTFAPPLNAALPVQLLGFDAQSRSEDILLTWETAVEKDLAYFEVQRAVEGDLVYTPIHREPAQNAAPSTYNYVDTDVKRGIKYHYRLRMADLDGKEIFSQVRTARIGGPAPTVRIFPNPMGVQRQVWVEVGDADGVFSLFSEQGALLLRQHVQETTQVSLQDLPVGTYFYQVTGLPQGMESGRLILQ
jgi:hypothetical protein